MRVLFFLLFFSFFFSGFSQNADSTRIKKYSITSSIFDYISEFHVIDDIIYNIEGATPIKNRDFLHFNLGYIESYDRPKIFFNQFHTYLGKTKGYRISLEGRHYLNKHKLFEPATLLFWFQIFQYHSL